ncbi:elongation factor G [soil metagenome]
MKTYSAENIRNVAIVGHGGVGKTMLTEHLLYTAGATDRLGAIESGTTQSDQDPLEVRRHISIGASVLPLEWQGCKINLVDVPGFPDFVGELHAVARVVEAFIIVTEAKHDLDVGFETAWEVAEEHGLAKFVFVNKLERDNADFEGLMDTLHGRYGRKIVSTQIPIGTQAAFAGVLDLHNMKVYKGRDRGVEIETIPSAYEAQASERREKMMDAAAEGDDDLAMKYLDGQELTEDEIEHGLLVGVETGRVVPVLLGSAASGIGVATLLDRICHELPSPVEMPKVKDVQGFAGLVFKTVADPFLGKVSYVRVMSGELHPDERLENARTGESVKSHHLLTPHGKSSEGCSASGGGDLCAVAKLGDVSTGDTLRTPGSSTVLDPIEYPEPVYRMAVRAASKADEDKLGLALVKLLDEDPTLRHRFDEATHQDVLEGMGDIHLDAAIEKLRQKYGVSVKAEEAIVPYRETIRKSAKAQGRHKRQTGGKGQFGDCWIEIEPLADGGEFAFESRVVGGAIPKGFLPAIEKGVREAMARGVLAGFPLVGFKATVYDGSYHDVDSNEQAFKTAGSLALRAAAENAGVSLLEPVMEVMVDTPDEAVGDVIGDLNGRRARVLGVEPSATGRSRVTAHAPLAEMGRYALDLRSFTHGRGSFRMKPYGYEEAPAQITEELAKKRSSEAMAL